MRVSTSAREDGSGPRQPEPEPEPQPAHEHGSDDPLLAAICHDLRAPLAAVMMGASFVLRATPEGDERSRRVLEAMLRSCRHMERLVRDFGDLSQVESDAVVLRLASHDAAEMLEVAVESARPRATARSVEMNVTRPEQPVSFRCDRDRVVRALEHVLDNACRVAPDGSTIATSVRTEGDDIVFEITDAGPGLSREAMEHLYDRAWLAKRRDRTGPGLGLVIVRGFVLAHGGRIDVDSEPGAGATFSLAFPASGPPSARYTEEPSSEGASSDATSSDASSDDGDSADLPSGRVDPPSAPRRTP